MKYKWQNWRLWIPFWGQLMVGRTLAQVEKATRGDMSGLTWQEEHDLFAEGRAASSYIWKTLAISLCFCLAMYGLSRLI